MTESYKDKKAVYYFTRCLIVFAICKVIFLWSVTHITANNINIALPQTLLGQILLMPSQLAQENAHLFYACTLAVFVLMLFLSSSYVSGLLLFWLVFNLYRVNYPITNGSDYVLLILLLWAIPLKAEPSFRNERFNILQIAAFNLSVFMIRLQVTIIYFISGADKLSDEIWRSGEAFAYIANLEMMVPLFFKQFFNNHIVNALCAWATILFQLAFVVLVWFKRTRLFILCVGVFFHLGVWIMLSLPDFSTIMIMAYTIFLKDSEYRSIEAKIKKWLP